MKKTIAVALLSAAFAAPAFADDIPAMTPAMKPAPAMVPSGHKHGQKMMDNEDDCDAVHEMGGHHADGMDEHYGHGMGDPYGYGMMGGQGDSMTMMMEPDMHLLGALNLSKEQQAKITRLSDELRHNNWTTQGLLNDETAKLRDLYEADKRDPAAIGSEYQKVFDLKRQMIETYLETQNRIEEILTREQLAQMQEARHNMHGMYRHHMH
ncbi:MAG: Spy/CpxP family protein refolding chaperone [Gallionellaceae bacterium]